MRNPWVGLQQGADPVGLARLLVRARERALSDGRPPALVRPVVGSSWARSREAGVDPERHAAPVVHGRREVAERWREHPLARFVPLVERLLCDFAYDAQHIVVIADADGTLLWSGGHPNVLAASEQIGFVPGRLWTERATGTNGVGTALAEDHAVQIFSAEHFSRQIQAWSCSGAPVHDPETGDALGVIDLSSGIRAAHPMALGLVAATASAVEAQLRSELVARQERLRARFFERAARAGGRRCALLDRAGRVLATHPAGWAAGASVLGAEGEPLGDGARLVWEERATAARPRLRVRALGRERAEVRLRGVQLVLPPRRSELLVLLALRPAGLTADELALELYGDRGKRMTVRAEVSRLRAQLGGALGANPYRLLAQVEADFLAPPDERAGQLLPRSRVPAIVAARAARG